MNNLNDYIKEYYGNDAEWFVESTEDYEHTNRINKIKGIQAYLQGKHKILNKPSEMYKGRLFEPRKIVLQYAKTILNFQTSYLIHNPVTLTGSENVVNHYKKVYRKGKFNRTDFEIVDSLTRYGFCFEYLYFDSDRNIKSKIIKPENSYPLFDDEANMIGFIEHWIANGISYWNVYDDTAVKRYTNAGGDGIKLISEHINVSGLPIHYVNENNSTFGRSDLDDIISILDTLEEVLSKFVDSFHKTHDPILTIKGDLLKGDGLPPDIIGKGIHIDENADAYHLIPKLDWKSFDTIYKTLMQNLLDTSSTPSVSMNQSTVANLAEVTIKMMYSLADMKAGRTEVFVREGMYERFDKIKRMLGLLGIDIDEDEYDTLDIVFVYARPQNERDTIDNLEKLQKIGGISIESILEHSPYTTDVQAELERLKGVSNLTDEGKNVESEDNDNVNYVDDES